MSKIEDKAEVPQVDNMELWNQLFQTDKKEVQPITGKGYKGDSPKPYYLIEKCTAMFGPCGIGWGYKIVDHGFNDYKYQEPVGSTGAFVERTIINHWCIVEFWYKWKGEKSEPIQQFGGTLAGNKTSTGKQQLDEDACKKSVTDALVKCMSCIGIAGDIFSGRWDDSKYHQEQQEQQQRQQQTQQQPQNQQEAQQPPKAKHINQIAPEKHQETVHKALAQIQTFTNPNGLNNALEFFKGSQFYDVIAKACDAKADLEGWR